MIWTTPYYMLVVIFTSYHHQLPPVIHNFHTMETCLQVKELIETAYKDHGVQASCTDIRKGN